MNKEKKSSNITKKSNLNIISKKSIIFSAILASIILLKILSILLINIFPSFSVFFIGNFLNIKNGILYYVLPYLPFIKLLPEYFQLIILISLAINFSILVFTLSEKKPKKRTTKQKNTKNKIINISFVLLSVTIFLFLYDLSEYFQLESIPNLEKTIYKEYSNKEYNIQDAEKLMTYLDNKMSEYSTKSYNNKSEKELLQQASKNLEKTKEKLPFLKGLYPSKIFSYDKKLKELYGANLAGLTSNYLVFYNDILPDSITLNTITHEFCHTKSVFKENEAVYCSYVAGINSDDDLSKYSAYMEAYFRIAFAYSVIDLEKSIYYEDKYLSKCLTEGKEEFCYIYGKVNKEYIEGTKYLWIKTYSLKNYTNHKEDLINSLSKLVDNGYTLKLELANETINLSDVNELIDSNSMDRIVIQAPLNKDKFEKIKNVLANDKLFLAVMQTEDEDSNFTHGEATEYFLGKVEDEKEIVDMYTYSRIIRLLLIYHDIYGYN